MSFPRLATAPLAAAMALCLCSCDAVPRYQAAEGVHAFLAAVQKDDKSAFEAHVDRAKLKRDVRRQIEETAAGAGFGVLGGMLGGPQADALMNQMISPDAFRIVWMRSGVSIRRAPSALELTPMLRMLGDDSACLHALHGRNCVLTFQNEGGTWKLVGARTELSGDEQATNT